MSKSQEWDWPPERSRHYEPLPQKTGWASKATSGYVRAYLRVLMFVLKVFVGAICGFVLLALAVAMKGLLSG